MFDTPEMAGRRPDPKGFSFFRLSSELEPAMEKLTEVMQQRIMASFGPIGDGRCFSHAELAEIESAADDIVAALNTLARQFEYVEAAARKRIAANGTDEN